MKVHMKRKIDGTYKIGYINPSQITAVIPGNKHKKGKVAPTEVILSSGINFFVKESTDVFFDRADVHVFQEANEYPGEETSEYE